MIQRIQSVYLSLVFILSLLFITGTLYQFTDPSGQTVIIRFTGGYSEGGNTLAGRDMILLVLSVLIPIIAAASIFLYKNRRVQSWLVVSVIMQDIILACLLLVHVVYKWGNGLNTTVVLYRSIIPIINLILLLLALRGIKKDEKLVKSYDRIR